MFDFHKVHSLLFYWTLLSLMVGCNSHTDEASQAKGNAQGASPKKESQTLELGEQARKNLNLIVKPARPTEYWRSASIPGIVADRPGISDRGVTSPAVGVVSEIHVFPGDTVSPGQRLVTLKLFSEYLQATQTQLFKASQEGKLVQDQLDRLTRPQIPERFLLHGYLNFAMTISDNKH